MFPLVLLRVEPKCMETAASMPIERMAMAINSSMKEKPLALFGLRNVWLIS